LLGRRHGGVGVIERGLEIVALGGKVVERDHVRIDEQLPRICNGQGADLLAPAVSPAGE
jgi:hypothetical protein